MNCLLGLTIQCARCHSHKLEPITHEEYYRLQAILYPAYCPDRWIKPQDRVVTLATPAERAEYQRRTGQIDGQIKALKEGLQTIAAAYRRQRKINDAELAKAYPEFAAIRERIQQALAAREKERPRPLPQVAALVEIDPKPPVHHLLLRGRHNAPGKKVEPGVPAVLCTKVNGYHPPLRPRTQISTGRRTAFARWVTSPDNPLFARVMVNRIWQHHVGVGLVATPDNLGESGARPRHPELLDYLTVEFIRSGWSVKAMQRLILKSAVYRQVSTPNERGLLTDPDNRLLGRFPLRRLDAEAVRDGMLAVSGELDRSMRGPYVPTRWNEEGSVVVDEKQPGARRRSIYLQQRRSQVATLLALFDAPSMVTNCSYRQPSTVPPQSLLLLNSPFARARAQGFARRLEREAGPDMARRMSLAFRLVFGREAIQRERRAAEQFLKEQEAAYGHRKDGSQRVWTDFCQMLLASNGFLYVE
jgi:hypothetical protein